MALHRGEQILATLKTLLSSGCSFSNTVDRNRIITYQESDLPALKLSVGPEQRVADYTGGLQDWVLPVDFSCVVSSTNNDLETLLFAYRRELHLKIMADNTLGLSFVIDSTEVSTDSPVLSTPDGTAPIAEQTWRWEFEYRRSVNDPSA